MAWQNLPSTATPVNATNLNSLDNSIVEGTWTPTIDALNETAPTVTYTTRNGVYKKIGKLVFYEFYIRGKITALNGTNNYAVISGLPFTVISPNFGMSASSIGTLYSCLVNETNVVFVNTGATIRIQNGYGASTSKWKITDTPYMEIAGSGFYFTS